MFEEAEQISTGSRYPEMADAVDIIMREIRQCRRKRHPQQPKDPRLAADWFIGLFEKNSKSDAPQKVPTRNGDSYHWVWPYLAFCRTLTNIFLHTDKVHQDLIIGAREEGIRWRGENFEELTKLIPEFHKMWDMGVEAYRKEAIEKMKILMQKMDAKKYSTTPF